MIKSGQPKGIITLALFRVKDFFVDEEFLLSPTEINPKKREYVFKTKDKEQWIEAIREIHERRLTMNENI